MLKEMLKASWGGLGAKFIGSPSRVTLEEYDPPREGWRDVSFKSTLKGQHKEWRLVGQAKGTEDEMGKYLGLEQQPQTQ